MSPASRRLLVTGTLLLAVMLIGSVVAIAAGWPAQFGGGGEPDDVAREALTRGTALSPPLAPVVLFVAALAASLRRGAVGLVGAVLLIVVSAVFVLGALGEASAAPTPDVPRLALVVSGLLAALFGGAVVVAAVARLRDRS